MASYVTPYFLRPLDGRGYEGDEEELATKVVVIMITNANSLFDFVCAFPFCHIL